jgi:hypothetical protein
MFDVSDLILFGFFAMALLAWIVGILASCGRVDRIDGDHLTLSPLFGPAFSIARSELLKAPVSLGFPIPLVVCRLREPRGFIRTRMLILLVGSQGSAVLDWVNS